IIARYISKPITALAAQTKRIGEGDLTVEVSGRDRRDEIGELAASFQIMVDGLKRQIGNTVEGINVLSSSAAEISATVAQLAMSTSKTSAAITETTTTVEQVKQAARVAGEKARKVAKDSQEAVKVAESGRQATEETVRRMSLIKDQMESIADTVVKLSEHSRSIEDIISTVQDLADQSNLLAVNASIEAARAGDHGRGFAVVAHEIKSLADQSRQATHQIGTILEDTRKWVSAVVMATEQGAKAVDAGVEQSITSGEAINLLAENVSASSQAAVVIHTSSEQQFVGVDQVAGAMANIEQAIQQSVAGTRQLEAAAVRLEELGGSLQELVKGYRT
ncbi:MAG: methyl-accepting chemotaxis protein, partial [Pseudomonadota bacterium]